MIGRRIEKGTSLHLGVAGDYWQRGPDWVGVTPNGLHCSLARHDVVEHEDGTISVTPSILVNRGHLDSWHGYLTRGVWQAV